MNGGGGFKKGPGGGRGNGRQWRSGPGVTVEDLDPNDFGGAAGFGDIFEQLFGRGGGGMGGAGGPRRTKPPRCKSKRRPWNS